MNGRALTLSMLLLVGVAVMAVNQRSSTAVSADRLLSNADVDPARSSDDALRRTIARAIYSHPTFWRDAALPEPSIQILVHGGHVVLTGTVAGEMERTLACSLARGHGEASVTNQLRPRGRVN
jgi:osmotically-inducible protein OsmY